MDYLLFNEDGSIKQSNLNQYVQEGDNNKQVLVAVIGLESGTALPEAICRLPNGQSVTLAGVWNEDEHGWIFTFTSSVTLYPGVVLVAIRISENGINRVMFPFSLMVNQTGVNPNTDTGISLEELDAYLLTIKNWIDDLNLENGEGENSLQQKGGCVAGYDHQFAVGKFNDNQSTNLFEVGNGTDDENRSNALEVLADGRVVAGANGIQNNELPRMQQVRLWKHTIYFNSPSNLRLVAIDKNSESMTYLLQINGRILESISHKLINENNMIMQLIGFPIVNLQVNIKYIDENGVVQTTPCTINTDSVSVYQ